MSLAWPFSEPPPEVFSVFVFLSPSFPGSSGHH